MSDLVRIEAPPAPPQPHRPRRLPGSAELAAYALFAALALAALLVPGWGLVAPDTKPELYLAPGRALRAVLAAWRPDPYLGQPSFDAGAAPAALAAAVVYVANPYVVVAGATNPVLLPYALLPWLLLAFAGSLREPRSWRWPALFALA